MEPITVQSVIHASVSKVWQCWTEPDHIIQWNFANNDWHCPKAENNLTVGGKFSYTMAAKDGSFSFDFWGVYDQVELYKSINYSLGDGRKVSVSFIAENDATLIKQIFDPEEINPAEIQAAGWQAILDSFKKHVEAES